MNPQRSASSNSNQSPYLPLAVRIRARAGRAQLLAAPVAPGPAPPAAVQSYPSILAFPILVAHDSHLVSPLSHDPEQPSDTPRPSTPPTPPIMQPCASRAARPLRTWLKAPPAHPVTSSPVRHVAPPPAALASASSGRRAFATTPKRGAKNQLYDTYVSAPALPSPAPASGN